MRRLFVLLFFLPNLVSGQVIWEKYDGGGTKEIQEEVINEIKEMYRSAIGLYDSLSKICDTSIWIDSNLYNPGLLCGSIEQSASYCNYGNGYTAISYNRTTGNCGTIGNHYYYNGRPFFINFTSSCGPFYSESTCEFYIASKGYLIEGIREYIEGHMEKPERETYNIQKEEDPDAAFSIISEYRSSLDSLLYAQYYLIKFNDK